MELKAEERDATIGMTELTLDHSVAYARSILQSKKSESWAAAALADSQNTVIKEALAALPIRSFTYVRYEICKLVKDPELRKQRMVNFRDSEVVGRIVRSCSNYPMPFLEAMHKHGKLVQTEVDKKCYNNPTAAKELLLQNVLRPAGLIPGRICNC